MGFSSWNHFGMRVSAPLLLDVADAFKSTGLQDSGYIYINTDDGWNDKNRSLGEQTGALHPAATFTNATDGIKAIADGLHAKGFKFGIYLAAGESTCGNRAGTLYHEFDDAVQIANAGVDYLKYDDCGEANLQSYARYHVMKDALAAAYAATPKGAIDYYSYEPFQVYSRVAVQEMTWTSTVGDLWRSGGDIRPVWKSILANARANNHWAPNARPGHFNDADMLEVGNGDLTVPEQRSHFALWCLMKSPLIIGADVRAIPAASMAILNNRALIAVNQDDLGIQGTLRTATASPSAEVQTTAPVTGPAATAGERARRAGGAASAAPGAPRVGSEFVGKCAFGTNSAAVPPQQKWVLRHMAAGATLSTDGGSMCLTIDGKEASITPCTPAKTTQIIDFGRANETVSQIKDAAHPESCLAYDGATLHMEPCRTETGDAPNATDCWEHNCRFSALSDQLFYLNGLGQLSLAFTNFQAPVNGPPRPNPAATNVPMCLVPKGGAQPPATTPTAPSTINGSLPLQVWAGPLAGGDVVVVLLNAGDTTAEVTAHWKDIGLVAGVAVKVTDLWTGKSSTVPSKGADIISATVPTHDVAAFRLTPA